MMYLIQTVVCSAIFYVAFYFLFKDKHAHTFNRFYLLSSLALAVVIPLCHIPVFPEYITVSSNAMQPIANASDVPVPEVYSLTWKDAIFPIYLLGILIHVLLFTTRLSQIFGIVKSGKRKSGRGVIQIITEKDIPVSSFFSYLFIPKDKENSITKYELYHEGVHIRQKHSWDVVFIEIIRVFYWFNPFIILYKKRLVEIHEFLADGESMKVFGQDNYEQFLALKAVSRPKNTSIQLTHNFYSLFEKRIKMMNSNVKTITWQYAFVLPIIAIAFMAFSLDSYPVYQTKSGTTISSPERDSFPPIPPELIGKDIDTIVTFDPITFEEQISYQLRSDGEPGAVVLEEFSGIDTLIIFDPDDFSETVIIINHDTGQRDTIR